MAKLSDLLGINARAADYLRGNYKNARKRADDKLLTKGLLARAKIPHPKLLAKLTNREAVNDFDWLKFEAGFAIKPAQGLGGQGVLVVRRKLKDREKWVIAGGKQIGVDDLRLHASDIIEGRYSRNGVPDTAMIEERVKVHPKFRKLAVGGTPDARVIVYNRVPVMAMLRIPTEESGGKANLHQGAIGLGIDMATGISTHGVYKDRLIDFFPDSKKKVNGITIPNWNDILVMAVKAQLAAKLNYLAVDFLIDFEKGPLVLELNDQPGLSIQLANRAGLKKRLERVEGLEIETAEKGVRVAKALFAARFAKKVGPIGGEKQVVGVYETVGLKPDKGNRVEITAKMDTGARGTSIDEQLVAELGLLKPEHILWEKKYKSALGEEVRRVIEVDFRMRGRRIKAKASVTKRHALRFRMIIGRRDLKGFIVNPRLIKTRKGAWKSASHKAGAVKKRIVS